MPELFIAALKPASFDENTSNLPILKISNMFTDQGPIPKIDNRLWFKSCYLILINHLYFLPERTPKSL